MKTARRKPGAADRDGGVRPTSAAKKKPAAKKPTKKKAPAAKKKATAKKKKATAKKKKAAVKKQAAAKGEAAEPDAPKKKRVSGKGAAGKTLLIVESPAKAKTIQKYLGKDFIVIASKGHVKDLPKRGGVDVDHGFEETYEVIKEKGKDEVLRTIKENARYAERVLLATDPDREGEAIAWHLMEEIDRAQPGKEIRRVLFNEITKKGVTEGIADQRDLDRHLYEAQRTRRVLDRIGGYPLSSLLWRKLAFGLSAGRVQTPALRILVDRQHEIDAFVPRAYWLLEARLAGDKPPPFTALLDSVGGEKLEKVSSRPAATSELDAKRFGEDLARASYRVAKITRRERRARAPAPYTTSKLQQDASTRLSMQPKRTMRVAQALYEGVPLGRSKSDEVVGLITYMRTDSLRVSDEAVGECRDYVAAKYGKSELPAKPNEFKSKKKNVQDAHEAIRPTRMDLPPEAVRAHLTDERFRLYKLIWDRFVASQMVPAVYDQTGLDIEARVDDRVYGLRASGSVLKASGWRAVYGATDASALAGEEGQAPEEEGRSLPPLEEGEALSLADKGVEVIAKHTEPPPYFNEASLVKKLEEEGIGRPSTYAEIISKVQARDYVKKVNNKLVPSDLGKLVIERLVADKFDLADIAFTRKLEEDLDAVAEDRGKRLDVLSPFHRRLQQQIDVSLEDKGKWWPDPEPIGESCEECGKDLKRRWGRNGPFIGCDGYPDCKYTRPIPTEGDDGSESRKPELTDYECQECGAPMMKRWGRNGWFLGCSAFPKCKFTRSVPLGVTCPKCGGEVVEIRARGRKRPFYGCTNYSNPEIKCDFRLWQRPHPEACPSCQATFLVRGGNDNAPTLRCVTADCGFQKPYEPPETEEQGAAAPPASGEPVATAGPQG